MTNDKTQGLIEPQLQPGEKVLWSYIAQGGAKRQGSRRARLINQSVQGLFVAGYLMLFLWTIRTTPALELGEYVKRYAPWIVGFIVLVWALKKFEITNNIDRIATRTAFNSAIITDQRVILFNYDIERSVQISAKNLTDAYVDYHEGGQALLIACAQSKKDNVLVGIKDFTQAASLIQTHLITPETQK